MAAKQAASRLWGANLQNRNTVAPMVRACSMTSEKAVERDSSTARKYPFMQVHKDMKGSPTPRMRRQGAAWGFPKKTAAAGLARKNSSRAMDRLMERQNPKHRATVERTTWRFPMAMAAVTIRVTARLMPEVESVTVNIKMEKISWYSPMPAAPSCWER